MQLALKIDQHVAAENEVAFAETTIGHEVVFGEDYPSNELWVDRGFSSGRVVLF